MRQRTYKASKPKKKYTWQKILHFFLSIKAVQIETSARATEMPISYRSKQKIQN